MLFDDAQPELHAVASILLKPSSRVLRSPNTALSLRLRALLLRQVYHLRAVNHHWDDNIASWGSQHPDVFREFCRTPGGAPVCWIHSHQTDRLAPHLWEHRVRPAVLPVDANREADLAVPWAGIPMHGDMSLRYPVGIPFIAVVVDGHALATDVGRGLRKIFREHAEKEAIHSCRREAAVLRVRANLAAVLLDLNELRAVRLPQPLALVWAAGRGPMALQPGPPAARMDSIRWKQQNYIQGSHTSRLRTRLPRRRRTVRRSRLLLLRVRRERRELAPT